MVSNEELRRMAENRDEEKIRFYIHFCIYMNSQLLYF
jgi:hypothetical protein